MSAPKLAAVPKLRDHAQSSHRLAEVIRLNAQTTLDVGCGDAKQKNCVGMDRRARKGVDVVHDAEVLPWPFEPGTFTRVVLSHVMEHLKPWLHVEIMDEIWRVMKPEGVVMLVMPYPNSHGHWQDPTHIKPWNETTARYFDPDCELYEVYKPKPWKIEGCAWRNDGNIEFAFRKRAG